MVILTQVPYTLSSQVMPIKRPCLKNLPHEIFSGYSRVLSQSIYINQCKKGPLRGLRRTIYLCTIRILGLLCTVFGHIQDLKNFSLGPHDFFRGRHHGGQGGKACKKWLGSVGQFSQTLRTTEENPSFINQTSVNGPAMPVQIVRWGSSPCSAILLTCLESTLKFRDIDGFFP